ncbi:PKD domain-containing protein, partial [bacterium]
MKNRICYSATIFCVMLLIQTGSLIAQTPTFCDFWSNQASMYRGTLITNSHTIKAFDARGKLCGQTTGISSHPGSYQFFVYGEYEGSPWPGGARDGEAVTFKINDETATVIAGSNVWHDGGSYSCDLDVPSAPPIADAGGPYSGQEGQVITFDGSGSLYVGTYSWNFGDGNTG